MSSESEADESDHELDTLFQKRRCTDVPCCFLFVVGMAALVVLFVYALANGNTKKLNHGIDARGFQCGVDPQVLEKPLLYFCPVITATGTHSVNLDDPICVSECPAPINNFAPSAPCNTPQTYATSQVGSRYCLPSDSDEAQARQMVEQSMQNSLQKGWVLLERVWIAWPVLLLTVILACIMGYIFLFMLKTIARCIIWICAIIGFLGFGILGAYLWSTGMSSTDASMHTTLQVLAVVSWVFSFVVALMVCCCGSAVDLSTACMGQAAIVIWRMPVLLLSPLIKAVLKTVTFLVLAAGFIQLISTGEVTGMGRERHLNLSSTQIWMLVLYLFLSFWLLAFMSALYQFSIAYAAAGWYCAPRKEGTARKVVNQCALCQGVRVGIWYHTGSLALGAGLIAFLEVLQRVLEWAEKKSQLEGDLNPVTSCVVKSLLCGCRCIEGIVQFVNKNVYIDIALTSKGFCKALGSIADIIIHHGAAMAILNGATFIFQIVGIASITACCGLLAALLLRTEKYSGIASASYLPNPGAAIAVCCVLAFIVGWAFMAIFDMTSDTLLICHAEDLARPNGPKYTEDNKEFAEMYARAEERAKELEAQKVAEGSSEDEHVHRYSRSG